MPARSPGRICFGYLTQQIGLVMKNHGVSVSVGDSDTPMPVHFAVATQSDLNVPQEGVLDFRCATSSTCRT
jgi:AMP nucleosidase